MIILINSKKTWLKRNLLDKHKEMEKENFMNSRINRKEYYQCVTLFVLIGYDKFSWSVTKQNTEILINT